MFRLSSYTYDFGPEPIPTKFRSFYNSVGAQGSGYINYEDNCQSSDVLINEAEGKYVDRSWRYINGTPTKRQVSKRQFLKRPVSKRLKRQVYKTSALQNVRFTKCLVYKTSGLQNIRLQKNIHIYSVLAL